MRGYVYLNTDDYFFIWRLKLDIFRDNLNSHFLKKKKDPPIHDTFSPVGWEKKICAYQYRNKLISCNILYKSYFKNLN